MRKIKWENIIAIAMVVLFSFCLIEHIRLNGLYEMLLTEIVMDAVMVFVIRYLVKDIRVNPTNW